jgi:hypothetical protein
MRKEAFFLNMIKHLVNGSNSSGVSAYSYSLGAFPVCQGSIEASIKVDYETRFLLELEAALVGFR